MSPEKLSAICDAVDLVISFNEKRRKALVLELPRKKYKLRGLHDFMALGQAAHAEILRSAEMEDEVESMEYQIENWGTLKIDAMKNLETLVGLGVRRTVNPQVHVLVQHLAKVTRCQADGTMRSLSLAFIALACGLSEGTVSKLKSGTYPTSVFPPTVKRGRRAAKR